MGRADANLAASAIIAGAAKAGDFAPDIRLPGVDGQPVDLGELLKAGPVVLSFYRGGWCPYCNLQLRALQARSQDFAALGASLIAVSPQTPDQSLSTSEKNELAFPVLSDAGSRAAKAYGISFDLAEELRLIYRRFGHGLPEMNGDNSWALPIPATFVINSDGVIAFAFVDTDYRNRLEPADIVAVLATLARRRAA
ncbi:MAG: peroxiredoxin-like family protein [Hyphomicrobium aestuarii]|nr:peroxiredoxin-like family protein [Hyphomicrobium aestuarii]